VSFHVDDFDELLAMRDRIRSKGVQVFGPIDHGFVQSIYFEGPEGLNLELSCGTDIDERAWIDPEVTGLCGLTDAELEALKAPEPFVRPAQPVPQPPIDTTNPLMQSDLARYEKVRSIPDDVVWDKFSETTPPVAVD
jgi:hypothetical protein